MFRKITDVEARTLVQGAILSFKDGERRIVAVFMGWSDRASYWTALVQVDGKNHFMSVERLEVYVLEVENMHEFGDYDS